MKDNKKKLFIVGGIALTLIAVLGITYAWLTQVLVGTKTNIIKAGSLDLILDDTTSNGINLEYAIPQSDSQGLNNSAYTFKVKNNGTINAKYNIYLEDEELESGQERMCDSNVKYNLVKDSGEATPALLSTTLDENNKKLLASNVIINGGGSEDNYSLKLWIDQESTQEEVANKVFKAKIKLEAVQTEESAGPIMPTMDEMCPNCVFAFDTNGTTIGSSQAPTGATADYTSLNKNYFLGYITNETTGVIERTFACGIENGTPFCIEGKDTTKYAANVGILNTMFPSCNADASSSSADCSGSSVYAYATSDGNVSAGDDFGECDAGGSGDAICGG